MAGEKHLEVEGKSADFIFNTLIKEGLSNSDAAVIASSWIFENFGRTKRTFEFKEPFPETDPACVSKFSRTFSHDDWVDGESVVQAEEGAGEPGFNTRFHRIEDDLDALATDVAQAFVCVAEMRGGLTRLLAEIRAEINRVNSDLHDCCKNRPGIIVDPVPGFGGLAEFASFLGTTKFAEKDVSLWKTDRGVMVLPAVSSIAVKETTDIRVRRAGAISRFIEETPAVRGKFPAAVTKTAFVTAFGNELTAEGKSVRSLLDIVSDTARFASLDGMVNAIAEGEAAALRTTSGAGAAIAMAFGIETEVGTVGEASVDRFESIPAKVRGALFTNDVKTMDELVKAGPDAVLKILEKEKIAASRGEVSEWIGMARTLIEVR